ncbi:hypothetical protein QCA50_007448 [Cerrena zonata]|uniref:Uncharacterized protein n=1 Tax=Cerrena zonata TaxID=2478898 RepID=A0AAW0GDB2_9APHY
MARPGDEYAHLRYGHKVREYYPHPRVRLIDDALIGYPSVSFIFPPGEIEENDESIYVYHGFGSCVIVTAHMIVRHEDWSWVGRNVMHQDITEEEEQNDDRNALLPFYQVTCINDDVAAKYHGLTWSDELFSDWDLWGGTHSSSIHTNCPDTEPTESDTSPSEDDDEGDLVQEAAWLEEEFEEDAVVQLTEEEALQIFEDMQW